MRVHSNHASWFSDGYVTCVLCLYLHRQQRRFGCMGWTAVLSREMRQEHCVVVQQHGRNTQRVDSKNAVMLRNYELKFETTVLFLLLQSEEHVQLRHRLHESTAQRRRGFLPLAQTSR